MCSIHRLPDGSGLGLPPRLLRMARRHGSLCDNDPMTADGTTAGAPSTDSPDLASLAPLTRRIVDLLTTRGVVHRLLRHPAVLTSEEASRVRGTPLEAGAKALVCHADERVVLIVVPADARLD